MQTSILWKVLTQNLSEDALYKSYFNKNFWTLDQFLALIVGFTPEKFTELIKFNKPFSQADDDKIYEALDIQERFISDIEYKRIKHVQLIEKTIGMSPWKYIKWAAENEIPIIYKFFKCLPLHLMELLIEFQPLNSALRLIPTHRREYHTAYYLKQAEELIENNPMTNDQIFKHPNMQNVMRYIRELGGNYKKSTIIKSWLPQLHPTRKKGRPKK